jgi:NodT family efflux transporter outer membrane factor (OMF) lipoprotein
MGAVQQGLGDGPRRGARARAAGLLGVAALVCVCLGACSHATLSQPVSVLPAAYEGAAAADPAADPAALDRWWTLFGDDQLTGLIETALKASPTARQALERVTEARALRAQTLSAYGPQGNPSASAQTQETTQSFSGLGLSSLGAGAGGGGGLTSGFLTPAGRLNTYAGQFQVSYELDLFGRRRAAARGADADVAAARFDYEAARAVLARDVAVDLFQARSDAIQLADARETLRIARELEAARRLSAERGLTSTGDLARLETDTANAQGEVARLEALARSTRRTLLALIGRGGDALESLPIQPVAAVPPAPPLTTPAELLRRRPDVRRAEAQLQSAGAALDLDKLALWPKFGFSPTGSVSKTTGAYDSTTSLWSLALNASLPVLDRPRLLATIRAQRARGEQAVAAYELAVTDAYRDSENGFAALAGDRARVEALTRAVERSRFAFDAARKGFDLGLTDLTTLLDAERAWRTARAQLTAAQTTALVDAATLFQALGGGWSPRGDVVAPTVAAR